MKTRYLSVYVNKGFSLVELMVGLTLGLIVTFVITGVWGVFEKQKSTTTSGATAQETGLIAITQIEQEVRNAGAGFNNNAAFECNTIYSYFKNESNVVTVPAPSIPTSGGLAPVVITNGSGATDSDAIKVLRSSEFLGALPATITDGMPQPSSELNVSFTKGFAEGQLILISQAAPEAGSGAGACTSNCCTVMQVTQVQDSALKIQHNPGSSGVTYNPAANYYNTSPGDTWPKYTTGANILNLGSLINSDIFIYSKSDSSCSNEATLSASECNLADTSFNLVIKRNIIPGSGASTSVLASNIVNMQAQYGIANSGQQNVVNWVEPTGTWAVLDSGKMKRIKAIRLALIARSAKPEAENVTGTCTNNAGTNYGPCAWGDTSTDKAPLIDLRNTTDWQKYRYRVYQIIIPLRNVIWAGV